jgi:hypothetical protein
MYRRADTQIAAALRWNCRIREDKKALQLKG